MGEEVAAAVPRRRLDRGALWLLLLSAVPTGIGQLAVLLLGRRARRRILADRDARSGLWVARLAMWVAVAWLTVAGVWVHDQREQRRWTQRRQAYLDCEANLRRIVAACRLFRVNEGDGQRFPRDWEELVVSGLIDHAHLRCPSAAPTSPPAPSYSYHGATPLLVALERFVLAHETLTHHHPTDDETGYLTVFADGRVSWVRHKQLQDLLHQQRRGDDR